MVRLEIAFSGPLSKECERFISAGPVIPSVVIFEVYKKVTARVFSSYVDNCVVANAVKQSHRSGLIDEMASALPRHDRFYSKKGEQLHKKIKLKLDEAQALDFVRVLSRFPLLEMNRDIALLAADLSIDLKLGMADSVVLAHAKYARTTLITLDNDFSGIPGVKVIR